MRLRHVHFLQQERNGSQERGDSVGRVEVQCGLLTISDSGTQLAVGGRD